jgi:transcriptional regulator with XRE-family HTH domain
MDDVEEQEIKSRFGAQVRRLRVSKGLSQEALALVCELDRTYIGGVERGERNISLLNINRLSRALNVHPSQLFLDLKP